jgi:PAS domain S-box-containing protein
MSNEALLKENEALKKRIAELEEKSDNSVLKDWSALADTIPVTVYQVRLNEVQDIAYLNKNLEEITGYPLEDFRQGNQLYSDIVHKNDLPVLRSEFEKAASSGSSFALEYRVKHKDGHYLWVFEQAKVVVDPKTDKAYMHGFILDITERKELEESLLINTNRFQNLITHAPYPIFVTNAEYNVEHANAQALKLLGLRKLDVEGHPIHSFLQIGKDMKSLETMFGDYSHRLEVMAIKKDGGLVPVELGYSLIDEGEHSLRLFTLVDLTRRKEIEEEIRLSEERLALATSAGNIGVWDWNVKTNELIWDQSMFDMYLIKQSDFNRAYDAWYQTLHPEDRRLAEEAVEMALKGIKEFDVEFRIITGEGDIKYVRATAITEHDEHGDVVRMVGVNIDITQQHEAFLQLQLSERTLNTFFEMAPIGIAKNDMKGKFLEINQEFARFTGYTKDELNALTYWDLTPADYEQDEAEQLQVLEETGKYGPYEKEYIHKSGYRYPVLLNGRIIEDANGTKYIWSLVQDMTELRKFDTLLRKSEERLKLALHAGRLGIFDLDVTTGDLIWDEGQFEIFEIDPEDFSGHVNEWVTSLHPDTAEEAMAKYESVIAGKEDFDFVFQILTKSGKTKHVHALGHVHENESGEAIRVVGTNADVTARYESEKLREEFTNELEQQVQRRTDQLRTTQHELQYQVDTLNHAALVCTLNIRGELTYVNELFLNTTGLTQEEVIGNHYHNALDTLDTEVLEHAELMVQQGVVWSGELKLKSDDGKDIYVKSTVVPFFNVDNKLEKFVSVFIDITEIKELQKRLADSLDHERKLNQLKSQFVSMASHQFRTPLAVIQSNSELFSMLTKDIGGNISSIIKKADNRIQKEVRRMTNMMNDVLILGKISSDELITTPRKTDMVKLCKSVVDTYNKLNKANGEDVINLEVTGKEKPLYIASEYVQHALDNLASNAIKYSVLGDKPKIELEFQPDHLEIRVTDKGIGIPEDELDKVFEPFHRARNIGEVTGTGLGLVIAKEYVEMNQGTIAVESTLGKGTRFTVVLPYELTPEED